MAANYTTSFNINVDDLQFILKQIKIAEATSIGYTSAPLSIVDSIIATYGGNAASAALLPAGLRTVDGTYNNLLIAPTATNPGTSQFGAADTLFPRLTDPVFKTANGPGIDFNGDGIIDVINHNYGDASAAPGTQIRSVADVDPRIISNLIVDMTAANAAAVAAALQYSVNTGVITYDQVPDALAAIKDAYGLIKSTGLAKVAAQAAEDAALIVLQAANPAAVAALVAANAELATAQAAYATAQGVTAAAQLDEVTALALVGTETSEQAAAVAALVAANAELAAAQAAYTTAQGVTTAAQADEATALALVGTETSEQAAAAAALATANAELAAAQAAYTAAQGVTTAAQTAEATALALVGTETSEQAAAQAAFDLDPTAENQAALDAANAELAAAQAAYTAAQGVTTAAQADEATALALVGTETSEQAAATATLATADAELAAAQAAYTTAQGVTAAAQTAEATALALVGTETSEQAAATAAVPTADAQLAAAQAAYTAAHGVTTAAQTAEAAALALVDTETSGQAAAAAVVAGLSATYDAAVAASNAADAAAGAADAAFDAVLISYGVEHDPLGSLVIPNQSPDIGLSPGFNSWMTFFGQFFDHGLDLVTKGTNGTVYIPLAADDPLYDKGADGVANNIVNAYFVTDPALTPSGQPLPAVSGVPTVWQAFYATDPANRALYAPGAFAPVITATPTSWAVKFNDDGAGADGLFSTADDKPNFMALTRATVTIDANGVPQHENTTTSWIDQNQTYTSHPSHQVFLREYAMTANGAVSTGRLIDGTAASGSSAGAVGNWGEVKAQAIEMLGIKLSDHDVNNVPLLLTDQYGKFIPGANGFARVTVQVQIVNDATGRVVGTQGTPFLMDGVSGGLDLANLVAPSGLPALASGLHYQTVAVGTNHAFLNDIAHHAGPGFVDLNHDGFKETKQTADLDQDTNHNGKFDFVDGAGGRDGLYDVGIDTTTDILTDVNGDGEITTADFFADDGLGGTYDNEMLDSHFITGDGRGNENIALTAVHSIFHSEHNRAVEVNKATLLANAADATLNSADHTLAVAFLNEWLLTDVAANSTAGQIAALTPANLVWDGERLFQAARFSTEMQYQHMVFEEFARRIQPFVDPFIFTNTAEIDPSIVAEFAHTVYRFGHSMLTGTVDRLENDLTTVNGAADQDTLLAVFLNPQAYTAGGMDSATINANLIRGLSRDVGNAMDEFIVTDVRSNLLGLPLDLAALNIARGRDTGIPSLNETRTQLYVATSIADLKPYANWADFAANIKNPMSIVNFIAAYGTHASILAETTVDGLRDAAMKLVFGDSTLTGQAAIDFDNDRFDFLNATGAYAGGNLGGMNNIDLWIGGLAEANPEFGGMLGTTFNYVFEYQMESLQNGDRLYYLSRTQGLNFLNQLEPNTFADMVMRNSELGDIYATHLNGFLFVTPDHFIELDRGIAQTDYNGTSAGIDPLWAVGEAHSVLTPLKVTRTYTGVTTVDPETGITHDVGGTLKFFGGEHVVVGGTEGNDKIWTDKGIDTLWGDGGNDYLNAGTESDNVFGGAGDDIIEDPFGDDLLRGNQGNDVISSARGFDIMFGDQGQDYIMLGQDASEVFAGQDNDFILGGAGTDGLLGNEGNDWIEGGDGLDGISGENSQLFFDSTIVGHDVLNGQGNDTDYDGESGDDIMVEGAGIQRNNGMFGFDWGIHKNDLAAANSDLGIPIIAAQAAFTLRDRFDSVEGLSGWNKNDTLTGAAILRGGAAGFGAGPGNPVDESDLKAKNVNLIDGLADLLGITQAELSVLVAQELAEEAVVPASPTAARSSSIIDITGGAEIIIGGGGNDTIQGNLGNDILDGDAWLNVRIKIVIPTTIVVGGVTYAAGTVLSAESMSTNTLVMGQYAGKVFNTNADGSPNFASPAFGGATLNSLMLNGTLNPGSLSIVREILQATTASTDVDTVVYRDALANYTFTLNANGSLNIAHTNPVVGGGATAIDDGTDTVRNFELYQFADGTHTKAEILGLVVSPPVITSNGGGVTAAISVAENGAAVTLVTATDANPLDTLTFSIAGGADAALFSIDASTGALSFIAAPNFEAPRSNVYDVVIQVSDGTSTDTQAVAVTVTNVNEAPVITSNGGSNITTSIDENSTAVTTITAIDPDAGAALTFSLAGGADAARFAINATTGALSFITAPDFEAPADAGLDNVYDVVVQVSDGTLTDTQAVAVTVTNVNEAPTITSNGGLNITTAIDENTTVVTTITAIDPDAGAALTFSLAGGADAARFAINATTGALSFITAPDFEAPADAGLDNVYDVVVQVSDGTLTDTQAVAVAVNNVVEAVNSPPTGALHIASYTPNATQTSASLTATNTLSDANGMTGFVPFQWQQLIAGVWTNIAGATIATLANRSNATVRVTSSYSDSFGLNSFVSDETAIIGTNGNTTIAGLAGNDIMLGLAGNDILNASAGNDTVDGGIGNDTYSLAATAADATVNLTTNTSSSALTGVDTLIGIETVIGGAGNDSMTDGAGASRLEGGNGNDVFIVTNDNARDILRGGNGVDTIDYSALSANLTVNLGGTNDVLGSGTAGNLDNINSFQNIISGSGNDSILGDNLVNTINGGGGNDSINGSGGADRLTGGTGADTFVYTATGNSGVGAGRDVIADFISGLDKLDFSAIDANTATVLPANEAFTFIGTGAFTAAAQVRYQLIDTDANGSLDSTLVRGNVNAGLGADFEVLLQGVTTAILATDIIL